MTKSDLIEKFRDINVNYDNWYDYVYEGFTEVMQAGGVKVERMFFSGFWTQGDGACFEGHVSDWDRLIEAYNMTEYLPYTAKMLKVMVDKGEEPGFSVAQQGRYSHEHCTRFSTEVEEFLEQYTDVDNTEQRELDVQMYARLSQAALDEEPEKWLIQLFRDEMRELYRQLENEYCWLTSDEAVWDTIEANELNEECEDGASAVADQESSVCV
jgi:uncharacterized protein Smg (DUF494 family)